ARLPEPGNPRYRSDARLHPDRHDRRPQREGHGADALRKRSAPPGRGGRSGECLRISRQRRSELSRRCSGAGRRRVPDMSTRAVITGMGVRVPMAACVDELKAGILAGRKSMIEVDRFDASCFKGRNASVFPAACPDPAPAVLRPWAERTAGYALAALAEAKVQSGIVWKHHAPERIAVVLGTSNSGIERLEEIAKAQSIAEVDPRKLAATSIAHVTNVVATRVAARGPRVTFSSACASSTAAVGHAMDLI